MIILCITIRMSTYIRTCICEKVVNVCEIEILCCGNGCFLSHTCTHTHTYILTYSHVHLIIKFYIVTSYTRMDILGSGGSSRPTLNQDTFAAPLAPVRPAPQPPGSSDPAPDIPPRPAATKQQKDLPPTPPPKVPLKPPMPTGE